MKLKRIQQNEYKLYEGERVSDYIQLMLDYIGDPDPELRDDLIYPTFCEWIIEKECFHEEELHNILSVLTDQDHLFSHVGSDGDDTVFTRTFSVLIVVQILCRHRKKPFLDNEQFHVIKDALICYLDKERDFRGYVGDKGWAHGAAHGADALDEIVQCEESNEKIYLEILAVIQKVLFNGKYIFRDEEDERLTCVVQRVLDKDLLFHTSIIQWIEGLGQCVEWERSRKQFITRVNSKNFLRCLYFRVRNQNEYTDLLNAVIKTENTLNHFFNKIRL